MKSEKRGPEHEIDLTIGRIKYREIGEGRPVVFVHGFLADGELWREVAPRLAAHGFRCITPDLPLGAHTIPIDQSRALSPRTVAAAVHELIERLGLDDVVLVGNDSGGAICQMVVTESTVRIGRLILTPCDTYKKFPPFPYNSLKLLPKLGPLIGPTMRATSTRLGRWVSFAPLLGGAYDSDLAAHWLAPSIDDRRIAGDALRFIDAASSADLDAASKAMAGVEIPTAFVWPRHCRFFTHRDGARLAGSMPNARMITLERGQTFVPLQHPEDVAAAIVEFTGARESALV